MKKKHFWFPRNKNNLGANTSNTKRLKNFSEISDNFSEESCLKFLFLFNFRTKSHRFHGLLSLLSR